MQKIQLSLPTLAGAEHLNRWRDLLRASIGTAELSPIDTGYGDRAVTLAALEEVVDINRSVDVPDLILPELPAPAPHGSETAMLVWLTLSQAVRGEAPAKAALRKAIDQLAPTALRATIDDNPEPWWQQEMMILHALHSFALRQRDFKLIEKTLTATAFHLAEIQPDHATNEPWAINAYATHADGTVTAETLLHAAYMNGGGVLSEVSRWIISDAIAALDALLDDGAGA